MSADQPTGEGPWTWWQARRLRYNLALAGAGWAAYGLALALFAAFGKFPWRTWQGGVSMTLFLGTLFLIVMGAANVCYLIGPALEAWMRPAEPERYRKTAFALGFWGSIALPFAFPAIILAMLIGGGGD
ncbi:MAG TPA: hypothetical protein VFE03_12525 [Caulobacteraceae bacterium]|jgi:hypothetical protein|nr:hypothetical protein [Caulobacteraceae bacterium]